MMGTKEPGGGSSLRMPITATRRLLISLNNSLGFFPSLLLLLKPARTRDGPSLAAQGRSACGAA